MKWTETESKLMKTIKCQDFNHALALLNKIAVLAESMNHHPDLKIYSYRFLSIEIYDTRSPKKIMICLKELMRFYLRNKLFAL